MVTALPSGSSKVPTVTEFTVTASIGKSCVSNVTCRFARDWAITVMSSTLIVLNLAALSLPDNCSPPSARRPTPRTLSGQSHTVVDGQVRSVSRPQNEIHTSRITGDQIHPFAVVSSDSASYLQIPR